MIVAAFDPKKHAGEVRADALQGVEVSSSCHTHPYVPIRKLSVWVLERCEITFSYNPRMWALKCPMSASPNRLTGAFATPIHNHLLERLAP